MKQTKTVKFIFAVALLIPVVLVFVGVIQSIALQVKRSELTNAQTNLNQKQEELKQQQDILDYLESDEYKNDYYIHEGSGDDAYGNEGDIEVIIKNQN